MAKYRQIHVKIWKDSWFCELPTPQKLFFIYLFSNELASISGIYEMSKRVMSFESGLSFVEIDEAFATFTAGGKAFYDDGVVFIPALRKYHETQSPKVQTLIIKDLEAIRECELKGIYCELYGIDRVSIPRYSSSNSSSSGFSNSSGFNENGKQKFSVPEYLPPTVQEFITDLSKTTKTPYDEAHEKEYSDAAYYLHGLDASRSDIAAFGEWWKTNGFYQGKPAIKSLLAEWGNFKDGVQVSVNGNGKSNGHYELPDMYKDIIRR